MKQKNQLFITCLLFVAFLFQANTFAQNARHHYGRIQDNSIRTTEQGAQQCMWHQVGQKDYMYESKLPQFFNKKPVTKKILTTTGGREIWGGIIYANSWNNLQQGEDVPYQVVSFSTNNVSELKTIKKDPYLNINGGAAIYDGKLHFINVLAGMGFMVPRYVEIDLETWQHTANSKPEQPLEDISLCATTTVTDPEDGTVYGLFYGQGSGIYGIGTIDYDNLKRTTIATTEINILASAMNNKGEWYGIGKDGFVYQIDKDNGELTELFSLNMEPCYVQGAIFDPDDDNLMYWAASFREDPSAFYSINIKDEKVELISTFPDNEEIAFMFFPEKPVDEAPAKVENIELNFVNESLQGEVSFTMPERTFGGSDLAGDIEWEILSNNVSVAKGSGAPGSSVKQTVTVQGGNTFIKIVPSNAKGKGEISVVNKWIGYDETEAVKNVNASLNGNSVNLTWETPVESVHDGYVDVDNIKYNILRRPDDVQVAENISTLSYTDILSEDMPFAIYYYEITAVNGNMQSTPSVSEKIPYGKALDVPFVNMLATEEDFALCSIVDNNEDGITWMFREDLEGVLYPYSMDEKADDWLIMPPVNLKNDRQYKLSYNMRAHQYGYVESMNVYLMQGNNVNENCTILAEYPAIQNDFYQTYNNIFTVAEDGEYRIAYQATSDAYMYGLHLGIINIEEGSILTAPDSVTDIRVIAAEKGKLEATVEFYAPELTCEKKTLNNITKIEVVNLNLNKIISTLESPQPGQKLSVVDNAPENGFNEYEIVAYNESGKGVSNTLKGYVGMDMPDIVTNIKIYDNLDGTAHLTWDVPSSVGINGGYVDTEQLTYTVYRDVFGEDKQYFAENQKELECYVYDIPTEGEQKRYDYTIKANSEVLEEDNPNAISTPYVVSGTPYDMPFCETFTGGMYDNSFWYIRCEGHDWLATNDKISYNGNGGCAYWKPAAAGDKASLNSGKIAISGDNPKIVFWYLAKKSDMQLNVGVRVDGQFKKVLSTIDFNGLNDEAQWMQCVIPVKEFKNNTYLEINFDYITAEAGVETAIDNVELLNVLDNNLNCNIEMPSSIAAGSNIPVLVKVRNIGENNTSSYNVRLYADGNLVEEKAGVNVESLATAEFNFDVKTNINRNEDMKLYAEVVFDGDMDVNDNKSEVKSIEFVRPTYPVVEDLKASENADGTVSLSWNAPSSTLYCETENFEEYEPFKKGSSIGPWKTLDLDGAWTFSWDDIKFPGSLREMSYIVFNPYEAENIDFDDRHKTLMPRNGDQYLICWDATYESPNGNDDWLISPELPEADNLSFSFFARSFNEDYGMEDFEILYSMSGSEPEDFEVLEGNQGAPAADWTLFEYSLPANTKHFAIRCFSKYKVAFMVDDITYPLANLTLTGYNIYRDGKLIASVDENATSFNDDNVENNKHTYQVTAVYTVGESEYSNMAVLTSIDGISTEDVVVRGEHRCIRIFNAEGKNVKVYTTDGKLVCSGNGTSDMNIYVAGGNYIVSVDSIKIKIVVK